METSNGAASVDNNTSIKEEEEEEEEEEVCVQQELFDLNTILNKVETGSVSEPDIPTKSSTEILSELFGAFNAEPPKITEGVEQIGESGDGVAGQKSAEGDIPSRKKKSKRSKSKYKHKDKKHKKKTKSSKKEGNNEGSNNASGGGRKSKHPSERKKKKLKDSNMSEPKLMPTVDPVSIKVTSDGSNNVERTVECSSAEPVSDTAPRPAKDSGVAITPEEPDVGSQKRTASSPVAETEAKDGMLPAVAHPKQMTEHSPSQDKESKHRHSRKLATSDDKRHHRRHHRHHRRHHRSQSQRHQRSRSRSQSCSRSRSRDKYKRSHSSNRNDRHRSHYRRKRSHSRDSTSTSHEHPRKRRSRSSSRKRARRSHSHARHRSRSESLGHIDKQKLLEIARKNAMNLLKQGVLPSTVVTQDKVVAIKAGGKSVAELTDFCKQLSKKEALGEASSESEGEDRHSSGSDAERPFHHPFQIKERPSSIVMNIRNSVQLPVKTLQEKTAEQSKQLRIQFPVSSGQQHRKSENEWVPVSPKKDELQAAAVALKVAETRLQVEMVNQVFPSAMVTEGLDIGSIVSQRLTAMRKLQENPNDVQALSEMYRAQKDMQMWAESKQQPGQFTGSTGVRVLSAAELASGYQAWAKKDLLTTASPVSGGMGMALLQKMGWRPGEGLGKNKEGTLEPLQLEIKMDKKGLVSQEELGRRLALQAPPNPTKTLVGKHPVSLLVEMCSKRRWGAPQFELCFECGPDHMKNFLFKVRVNGNEYKPSVASPNKKQAKAEAATICLQALGVLPS